MYKNVVVKTLDMEEFTFEEAELVGVNVTGFLVIKVNGRWHNFNIKDITFYAADEVTEEIETSVPNNVIRLS